MVFISFIPFNLLFLIAIRIDGFISTLPVLCRCVFLFLLTQLSLLLVNIYSLICNMEIFIKQMNHEQIE